MGFGNGSGQKGVFVRLSGWVWACMRVCVCASVWVCVRGLFLALDLLKGALCAAISLWDFWDWQRSPETKQFVHFLEGQWTSVSVRVRDQWVEREREGKRGCRYVHKWAVNGQILQHIYITCTCGHTGVCLSLGDSWFFYLWRLFFSSRPIIPLRRCHFLHGAGYTACPFGGWNRSVQPQGPGGNEGWSGWVRKRSVC